MDKKFENSERKENKEIILNDIASDQRAREGEGEIKKFDNIFPDYQPLEDVAEISSTDDV